MRVPTERQAGEETAQLLGELLGVDRDQVQTRPVENHAEIDYLISLPERDYLVEYRATASSGPLTAGIEQIKRFKEQHGSDGVPLIVVPFMGKVGRDLCDKLQVCWLDLSGNAKIMAKGVRIWIEGRPNRFSGPGRPPNLFAPKSSRITRQLLLKPHQFQSQAELAARTQLDDGYVSKIVRRLKDDHLVTEDDAGAVRARDPNRLLDAWQSVSEFSRNRIVKGHVEARTGDALVTKLSSELERSELDYAVTGLAAAWLWTHFATFRIGTIYLRVMPPKSFLDSIEFWGEEKGANTWFVLPKDEGVFDGCDAVQGITCVSPVQAYIDLKDHPERAKEAADALREKRLNWSSDGK